MDVLTSILVISQTLFACVAGLYFYNSLKYQQSSKNSIESVSVKRQEKLIRLRNIRLNNPLSEETRPKSLEEIVGQQKGIRALEAALCGPNPQHILIYGPPGIGKTAAARLVLEVAKKSPKSPFTESSPFVEIDATILQFDERSIADPLIGSVHDPIYQGAGAFGQVGIPQPKPGAVTSAHGGVLFVDEIGELNPIQMNKLLKVLEDRKVILSSSYYSGDNKNIPKYIHDIFRNGLPADFRLIGATTRTPDEIPTAVRSRCCEVFFKNLSMSEITEIARNAIIKTQMEYSEDVPNKIAGYACNGRDAVNIVQTIASHAVLDERNEISCADVEEVIEEGHYNIRYAPKISRKPRVGVVNALAVAGNSIGAVFEIESVATKAKVPQSGKFSVTGIVEEEELQSLTGKVRRHSTVKASVENVVTLLSQFIDIENYDIHLNFPGGIPVDGPSAGAAIYTVVYSAIMNVVVPSNIAITGEVTIKGFIKPVGGVTSKIEAAEEAGINKVFIPFENYQNFYEKYGVEIVCLSKVDELVTSVFGTVNNKKSEFISSKNFSESEVTVLNAKETDK